MYDICTRVTPTFIRVSDLLRALPWVESRYLGRAALHETPSVNSKSKMSKKCPKDQGRSRWLEESDLNRPPFWSFCIIILWALCGQDPFELDANLQEASEQALFLGQWSSSTRMAA